MQVPAYVSLIGFITGDPGYVTLTTISLTSLFTRRNYRNSY